MQSKAILQLHLPADKDERLEYIRQIVKNTATMASKGADLASHQRGGRTEALIKLHQADPISYSHTRNYLSGAVTQLSPYLRHGCLTLNETVAFFQQNFGEKAGKLIFELAWRQYWRLVWFEKGDLIFTELEPPKVAIGDTQLSEAIQSAKTGLPCMDSFISQLINTGYLHNHARMWLASYIVHFLKIDWRSGADWFESHLLDGDFASNHLSWQWITSTFSNKPYFFNKDNLSHYTSHKFCSTCKAMCPFDSSYESLQASLFTPPTAKIASREPNRLPKTIYIEPVTNGAEAVYIHDEMLSSTHPLMSTDYLKIFVFDPALHGKNALYRLQFIADCLVEMPNVEVWLGDTRQILVHRNISKVITQDTPYLKLRSLLAPFNPSYEPQPSLVNISFNPNDLKRFSRYWQKISAVLLSNSPT